MPIQEEIAQEETRLLAGKAGQRLVIVASCADAEEPYL